MWGCVFQEGAVLSLKDVSSPQPTSPHSPQLLATCSARRRRKRRRKEVEEGSISESCNPLWGPLQGEGTLPPCSPLTPGPWSTHLPPLREGRNHPHGRPCPTLRGQRGTHKGGTRPPGVSVPLCLSHQQRNASPLLMLSMRWNKGQCPAGVWWTFH